MNVTLRTDNGNLNKFIGTNTNGKQVIIGTEGEGVGPMESVLLALAGCSVIDVIMILKKMRQDVADVEVAVQGARQEEIPRTFTQIHLHYKLYGRVKQSKAEKAIQSSVEKYCSVSKMLEKAADISTSFEIISK